jgi:hypothetical protein
MSALDFQMAKPQWWSSLMSALDFQDGEAAAGVKFHVATLDFQMAKP